MKKCNYRCCHEQENTITNEGNHISDSIGLEPPTCFLKNERSMCVGVHTQKQTGRKRKLDTETKKGKETKSEHMTHAPGHCLWDPGTRELSPCSIEGVTLHPRFSERFDFLGLLCVQSRRGTQWITKCHLFCMLFEKFHLNKTHK